MKTGRKRVSKKYHRERSKSLLDRYVNYFNRRRNAGIEMIGSASTADPTNREIRIRYEDGHEVPLGYDVLNWTQLFDKLSEMHPKAPGHAGQT